MAVTTASDLFTPEVSLEYGRQAFVDSLALMALMGGPGSPIEVANDPVFAQEGQYLSRPIYKRISSLVTKRDLTSVSTVTDLELTGGDEKAVKMHKKIGGVARTLDASRVSRSHDEQLSAEIGRQAGEQAAVAVRDSILNAMIGAIAAIASTLHTRTSWAAAARTNLSPEELQSFNNLFGDRQGLISDYITRSEPMGDMITNYLGRGVTGVADVQLRQRILKDTLGRNILAMDAAALTTADAGFDKYHTLAIGPGAIQMGYSLPLTVYPPFLDTSTEQVLVRWRADFDFWIGIRGMAYQSGVGGANPTDSVLATSSSWGVIYSDVREVLLGQDTHNYSGN